MGRDPIGTFSRALWIAVIGSSFGGCLRDNPRHCANLGGDAVCVERHGARWYCSRCTADADGCITDPPIDACHVPSDPDAADGSSGEPPTTEETGWEDEPDQDCSADGLDPSCPDPAPYCVDGMCASCRTAGGSTFCRELDPNHPQCFEGAGVCVACLPDQREGCPSDQPHCDETFSCTGCAEHDHCPESACDIERGRCFPRSRVFWVSNENPNCPGTGTETDPYCEIKLALERILPPGESQAESEGVVRVVRTSTPYAEPVHVTTGQDKRVALVGIGAQPPMIRSVNQAVSVGNHRVYLSNLSLSHNDEIGLRIANHGRVWVDDATITGNPIGVSVLTNARAWLRRVRVVGNRGDGVTLRSGARLHLASSIIGNNGDPNEATVGLRVEEGARFDALYATIANNEGSGAASIRCMDAETSSVRNSIVASPMLDSIRCTPATFSHSYLDTEIEGDGIAVAQTFDASWFVNLANHQFRPAPNSPFQGVAVWQIGDPFYDLAGMPRRLIPGRSDVAGALLP